MTTIPPPSDPAAAQHEDGTSVPVDPKSRRLIDSAQLLQGEQELLIRHGGDVYRLRLTRSGKLILHK